MDKEIEILKAAIHSAYYRIGTYIGDDPKADRTDSYVQLQINNIEIWTEKLNKLLEQDQE